MVNPWLARIVRCCLCKRADGSVERAPHQQSCSGHKRIFKQVRSLRTLTLGCPRQCQKRESARTRAKRWVLRLLTRACIRTPTALVESIMMVNLQQQFTAAHVRYEQLIARKLAMS